MSRKVTKLPSIATAGDSTSPRNQKSDHEEHLDLKGTRSRKTRPDGEDPFTYRHFYTINPTVNRLLEQKWSTHSRKKHIQKLRCAKPTIDNSAPKIYPHLQVRLKKQKMEEGEI
jgi:hypothetical protein